MSLANARKRRVAVLGATGLVGQRLICALLGHPWFDLVALGGSARHVGQTFAEAVSTAEAPAADIHAWAGELVMQSCVPGDAYDCDVVFSALPAAAAAEVELAFARAGYVVVSNASAHRLQPDIPLVVPEINRGHLALIEHQRRRRGWRGCIVTNPNCSTIALTLALAPLATAFDVEAVQVTTLQALSGAGANGPAAFAMLDNVLPYIQGEEEKLEREPRKLLGTQTAEGIEPARLRISAQCNRVGSLHGHLACVAVKLARRASQEDLIAAWDNWHPLATAGLVLPSAPARPVIYMPEPDRPQPRLDRDREHGMATLVGRLRPDPVLDYKFVALGHNLIRGAAGGTLLLAELLHSSGVID